MLILKQVQVDSCFPWNCAFNIFVILDVNLILKSTIMKSSIQNIESLLITIQNKQVLIDRDVAQLYGVQTRDINKAVKNNPDKFPES